MVKKPTRLRFTEDDLSDVKVQKVADRAEKATDKAEKAVDKLASKKSSAKLRKETSLEAAEKPNCVLKRQRLQRLKDLLLQSTWQAGLRWRQ